jgi:hypothetical protein
MSADAVSDPRNAALVSVSRARDGDGPDHSYTIALTGSGLHEQCVWLQYTVSPIPYAPTGDHDLHEGGDVGIAVDGHRHVHHRCRSAYRVADTGGRVVGALKVGPATWPRSGVVRVLFAPFAHTPGLDRILCEACVILQAGEVRSAAVRRA